MKEVYRTIQGEGAMSGRAAVFVRFAGCNGWSGRESDRAYGPFGCSAWCDTDFVGVDGACGGRYEAGSLADKVAELWGESRDLRFVVLTGGEPALQVDSGLISALSRLDFTVAIETNGTRRLPPGIHWITVSPKAGCTVVLERADELKFVHPQEGIDPATFAAFPAGYHFLQPKDGPDLAENTRRAVAYCLDHPRWRLSVQVHNFINIH